MLVKNVMSVVKVLVVTYIVTGLVLVLLTTLLYRFGMGTSIVSVGVVVAYLLSGFVGGFLIGKKKKEKKFLWGALVGGAYFVVLVVISLFVYGGIQGEIGNLFTTMVMCVGSGMIGGMVS